MKGNPYEFTNVAKLGATTNQSSSASEYTTQRSQANIREAKTKRRAKIIYIKRKRESGRQLAIDGVDRNRNESAKRYAQRKIVTSICLYYSLFLRISRVS